MVWGANPIWLPYQPDEPLCAAAALAQIELHDALGDRDPSQVALFTLDNGEPFSESQLDHTLRIILESRLPKATAKLYSWHSARIFLATVLAEFGASDRQIQALCRWQTDEALKVYIRLNSLKCEIQDALGWCNGGKGDNGTGQSAAARASFHRHV